ncbi:hypothetical protein HO173_008733 [Letharia columbiana]|uniref:Uncharacterized protein n=1 Tax=Letharia columbiana TaxID=112416 RepID=A0A8H6L2D9_9LECA|nr:uncharacterized protein HO173_008733 [Letharia columbiana]KAF6232977.1 hypothetical protein HO173_008733 [Letharia columbiana]
MNTIVLDTPRENVTKRFRHKALKKSPNGFTAIVLPYILLDQPLSQHYLPNQLTTQLATQSNTLQEEEQEEELQQANAENTAEKPSGNKAPSTKNTAQLSKIPRHMLSTIPHQIITQGGTTTGKCGEHCGEHCGETKRQQGPQHQEHGSALQDPTSYQSSTQSATQLATQSDTLQEEEQEEELQQANAENTAEKPSGNKAPSTKNTAQLSKIPRHMLSTVPHQIITQ